LRSDRAWLIAHTDQMKQAYRERVQAGYDPAKEKRDLREAIGDRCLEAGMTVKDARRFVKEQV
jgi:hypothetical protein